MESEDGSLRKPFSKQARGNYDVSVWKEIIKETTHLKLNSNSEVGKRNIGRFWEDSWCSETSLCELYPSLFFLVGTKEATVMEACQIHDHEVG